MSVRRTPFFAPVIVSVPSHRGTHHGEGAARFGSGAMLAEDDVDVGGERADDPRVLPSARVDRNVLSLLAAGVAGSRGGVRVFTHPFTFTFTFTFTLAFTLTLAAAICAGDGCSVHRTRRTLGPAGRGDGRRPLSVGARGDAAGGRSDGPVSVVRGVGPRDAVLGRGGAAMLNHSAATIYLCLEPTDMRKSFDTLAGLVREHLKGDPQSGTWFVFRGKGRGRDRDCSRPPAQIRTSGIPASGSYFGCLAWNRTLG